MKLKHRMLAALSVLALTTIAAVFACNKAPEHKLGGSLDYAPSGVAPFVAECQVGPNCLNNLNVTGLPPGAMAFVYSTKTWFYYDPSSTSTVDNSGSFAAKADAGNWVMIPGMSVIGGGLQDSSPGSTTWLGANEAGYTLTGAQTLNNLVVITGSIGASSLFITLPNNVGQCWYVDVSLVTFTAGKFIEIGTGSDASGYAVIFSGDAGSTVFNKTLFQACVTQPGIVTLG